LKTIIKKFYYFIFGEKLISKIQNIFGNKKYRKFVVITRSRTGSNLFMSLLSSHPNINAHGEIFSELHNQSCQKIWRNTFVNKHRWIKYVGFKIFYHHPLDSIDKNVWQYLEQDNSIKIIHLKRENILRAHISDLIAQKTNKWTKDDLQNTSIENRKINVNIDECLNMFDKVKRWEKKTYECFQNHPYIELTYEELTSNLEYEMSEIFNFLKIKNKNVYSKLKKQNPEKTEELVLNFKDLKNALIKNNYSHLLENE